MNTIKKTETFCKKWDTISFLRRTLLRVIIYNDILLWKLHFRNLSKLFVRLSMILLRRSNEVKKLTYA